MSYQVARRTFPKAKYGSEAWLEQRRTQEGGTVFGASEVPALMGASPFDSLTDLVIKKVNPNYPRVSNDATERGHLMEPTLLEYARRYYGKVTVPDVMYQNHRIVATLDGIQLDDAGTPIRTVEAKDTTAYALNEPVPQSFFWQVQAQMDAVGCDESIIVCSDRYKRFGFWVVERDDTAISEMREQAERIGSKIDNGEIISELDHALTTKQVELLFPKPVGTKELTANDVVLIGEWQARKEALEHAKAAEQELRDQVSNLMREYEVATFSGQTVLTYKRQTRKGSIDIDRLLNHHPEIAEIAVQYRKPDSAFRVLRVK